MPNEGRLRGAITLLAPSKNDVQAAVGATAESVAGTDKVGRVYLYTFEGD